MKNFITKTQQSKPDSDKHHFSRTPGLHRGNEKTNNRTEAAIQRKFQKIANSSSRLTQFQLSDNANTLLQKQNPEEDELLQGRFYTLQRNELDDEEMLQGQFQTLQRQENNTGLPDNLKAGMESLTGTALNHVRVHYNSAKPAAVQAHAYAQGSDIHLAGGQEKHLPHELGHVVQQMEGRVKATTSVGNMQVNDNPGLEAEATSMGEKALLESDE